MIDYKEGINIASNIVSQVGKNRLNLLDGAHRKSEESERRALKFFPSFTQKHSIQIHSYNDITMPDNKLMIFGLLLYSGFFSVRFFKIARLIMRQITVKSDNYKIIGIKIIKCNFER